MKAEYKIVLISLLFGVGICALLALEDAYAFNEGTYWQLLVGQTLNDKADRLFIIGCAGLLGFLLSLIFARQRRTEQALRASEEKLRSVLDNVPDFILTVDRDGVIQFFNRKVSPTRPDSIGTKLYDHVQDHDRDTVKQAIAEAFQTGECVEYESSGPSPDEQSFARYACRLGPIKHDGQVVALTLIATDITKHKQAQEELIHQKEFSQRLINSSVDGILAFDRECRYTVWNAAMERLSGVSEADVLGRCAFDVFPFLKDIGEDKYFFDALAGKTAIAQDRPFVVPKTGAQGFFEGHYSPLRNDTGQVIGGLGVIRNITERKQAADQLRQSEEHHREAAETNLRLLQEVNHRVRNNLANLLSLIRIMHRQGGSFHDLSEALETRVIAMAEVHTLLANAGWTNIQLQALIRSTLAAIEQTAPHQIAVNINGPPVRVHPRQCVPLAMSIVELFNNSCKYGAHSVSAGVVHIAWATNQRENDTWVQLNWREAGAPTIDQPVTPSLGTELIEGFINYELGGRCHWHYPPTGADHTFEFMLNSSKEEHPQAQNQHA